MFDKVFKVENEDARRQLILTWVQPGLIGFVGAVPILAIIFVVALATQDAWTAFMVGLAASVGQGVSTGLSEAVSDDGKLSGRGSPIKRGIASGMMAIIGGLGYTLPFLIPDLWTAIYLAIFIGFIEFWLIIWMQNKIMKTPFFIATYRVVLGSALIIATTIFIGGA